MEAIAHQSVKLCPFMRQTISSAQGVKQLRSANLPAMAKKCPVVGHAMQKRDYATASAAPAAATASKLGAETVANHATQESSFDFDGLFERDIEKNVWISLIGFSTISTVLPVSFRWLIAKQKRKR